MTDSQVPVSVSLDDLSRGNIPFTVLEEAFGPSSLGILIVKDLKPEFKDLRHKLLSFSSYLANLPKEELDTLESPEAKYLVGWSLGKERLSSGRFDDLKGSYYANCSFYNPPSEQEVRETLSKYPNFKEYTAPSIWPRPSILPQFQDAFERLCTIIIDVAILVAQACDRYAEAMIPQYRPGYLTHVVRTSFTTKARLLHYFPPKFSEADQKIADSESSNQDDWCGEHLDHGCLTGLTSAMFIDEDAHPPRFKLGSMPELLPELSSSPDPSAGLYIRSRKGMVVKTAIPKDCLAFQTGEALERITEGRFKAVSHFVRGAIRQSGQNCIARNTLAVFTQPNLDEFVDKNQTFAEFARIIVEKNTML